MSRKYGIAAGAIYYLLGMSSFLGDVLLEKHLGTPLLCLDILACVCLTSGAVLALIPRFWNRLSATEVFAGVLLYSLMVAVHEWMTTRLLGKTLGELGILVFFMLLGMLGGKVISGDIKITFMQKGGK
jgi:hypothetical protein